MQGSVKARQGLPADVVDEPPAADRDEVAEYRGGKATPAAINKILREKLAG